MKEKEIFLNNIKYLMEESGMTYESLASLINTGCNDKNVESWVKNGFPDDILPLIYEIFEKPEFVLKNFVLSEYSFNFNEFGIKQLKVIFPFFSNKKIMENENFKKGFLLHMELFNFDFGDNTTIFFEKYNACRDFYCLAFEENIIYSLVNILSVSSFFKFIMKKFNIDCELSEKELEIFSVNNFSSIKKKKIRRKIYKINNHDEIIKFDKYIYEDSDNIISYINILRNRHTFLDIADYYLFLSCVLNLIISDIPKTEYSTFGLMYSLFLHDFDNKYIKDFFALHPSYKNV